MFAAAMKPDIVKALRAMPDAYVRHGRLEKGENKKKKFKLHAARLNLPAMTREVRACHDLVAAHLLADGGDDLASITPNRNGGWYERYAFYEKRFTYLLKQKASVKQKASAVREDLALHIVLLKLRAITARLERASSMEVCDE